MTFLRCKKSMQIPTCQYCFSKSFKWRLKYSRGCEGSIEGERLAERSAERSRLKRGGRTVIRKWQEYRRGSPFSWSGGAPLWWPTATIRADRHYAGIIPRQCSLTSPQGRADLHLTDRMKVDARSGSHAPPPTLHT